jgi:hypothetical protein
MNIQDIEHNLGGKTKMKKSIILLTILGLFVSNLTGMLYGDSSYSTDNTTITVSSATATLIPFDYGFREIYLGDPDTIIPVYYTVDGDSLTVTTNGWWIPAGQGQGIEFNGDIYVQLPAGEASITIRKMTYRR